MSWRRSKIVLLCEDRQHAAFARRFFQQVGWSKRDFYVSISPRGRGAGEQWVRERFPSELETLRTSHVSKSLVVVVDADRSTVESRLASFDRVCEAREVTPRKPGEPVAIFVARRNIETWIAYLEGIEADEEQEYPKLSRQRDCAAHVKELKRMCDRDQLREPCPPSLRFACSEYWERLTPSLD